MPTIEERVQAIEQEHTQLKKTIELQTIAIGALVNKATLERLNEKYDKLFEVLIAHDRFTNDQLAELRQHLIEEDGKIVGLQTEMRQRFNEQDSKITGLDGKIVGLQTEMRQRFNEQDSKIVGLQTEMHQRFNEAGITGIKADITGIKTTINEHTKLLTQILERLPKAP